MKQRQTIYDAKTGQVKDTYKTEMRNNKNNT